MGPHPCLRVQCAALSAWPGCEHARGSAQCACAASTGDGLEARPAP